MAVRLTRTAIFMSNSIEVNGAKLLSQDARFTIVTERLTFLQPDCHALGRRAGVQIAADHNVSAGTFNTINMGPGND